MNSNFDAIHDIVKQQTADFKKHFMELSKSNASKSYDNLPNAINKLKTKYEAIRSELKEISKSYTNEYGGIISMKLFNEAGPKQRPLWKEQHKIEDLIRVCEKQIALGKDKYIEIELDKAEMMFDGKVFGLASKLDKKGFSPNDILFSSLSEDPKLFDVYISSGPSKVHARSVLAALNSDCMIAHFRFIITNVK